MNNEERKLNIDEVDPIENDFDNEVIFGSVDRVESAAIKQELVNIMTSMIEALTPEEQEIIKRRNGFYTEDGKPESRKSISEALGVSVHHIRCVESQAYIKLYKMAWKKQLRDYIS